MTLKSPAIALALLLGSTSLVAATVGGCSSTTTTANDAGAEASTPALDASVSPPGDAGFDGPVSVVPEAGVDAATDGGFAAQEKLICDARASRVQCTGTAAECSESTRCLYARIAEPAAVASYAACYGAPSCKGDDLCIAQAGEAVGGQPARDYVTACTAKVAECGAAFPDSELCSPAAYAYQGVGAAASACLAKPCAEQKGCFDAALKPIKDCKAL